jgi:hypothetical protein
MKKKIVLLLVATLALGATISFWIKELTKLPNFDIFETIEDEEDL